MPINQNNATHRVVQLMSSCFFEYNIREELEISQKELAATLGIKQPSLSAIENRGHDLKISTMKKYVEAMGGKLRIDVELPTGKHIGFNV